MLTREMIEALYAKRDVDVGVLAAKEAIVPADLLPLDRLGRFRVACELWGKCSSDARAALLNDAHSHVRSAAVIATQDEQKAAAAPARKKQASMGM